MIYIQVGMRNKDMRIEGYKSLSKRSGIHNTAFALATAFTIEEEENWVSSDNKNGSTFHWLP